MKRSEMIELIKTTVNSIIELDMLMTHDAEYVLRKIEEMGMLPPFSYKTWDKSWKQHRDNGQATGNEWEPEDEL